MTSRFGPAEPGASAGVRGAVRLVCDVCAVEFGVPAPVYRSLSGIVACPRCGALDLVLIDPGDDTGEGAVSVEEPDRSAG